jgi:hypothetical protein
MRTGQEVVGAPGRVEVSQLEAVAEAEAEAVESQLLWVLSVQMILYLRQGTSLCLQKWMCRKLHNQK